MIDAHIFRLPSTNLSQESKEIKGITFNLYKARLQPFKNDFNSLDTFKPTFKIGFFSLISIGSLKRKILHFL